ncbi:uncharacterized protein FOMMEDRAFT_170795 [Fomitiporia mediterranea MF3/22]|uniref:uncharacterized protein n=1 Tax=Fomitiporia mediterranea (strain MF3/22) TaxID=694068 RepID=UPI0004407314|nr:uncharacterized protein FOMMEDRAFT_170795 [Fomitiporia mediterranea MF3/22]EJC99040.1 hypothetical protein FOMMEDRAFT_170795 [Fomitiporia mediterranea MF3/22]
MVRTLPSAVKDQKPAKTRITKVDCRDTVLVSQMTEKLIMQRSFPRHACFQPSHLSRQCTRKRWIRRYTSEQNVQPQESGGKNSSLPSGGPVDPRPRWLFSTASLLRVVLVPTSLIYAVFFHDFGEQDHVFVPPRRWLQRQKESFFTLSPAEKDLAKKVNLEDRQ